MTSFFSSKRSSTPPPPAHRSATQRSTLRTAGACLLALSAPSLFGLACSDDSDDPANAVGGSAGTAGAGGSGNAGTGGTAGTGGSAGAAAGAGGSAGTGNLAGSGGGGGSGGMDPDAGAEPDGGSPDGGGALAFTLTSTAVDGVPGCGPAVGARDLCDLFPAENTGLNGAANVSPQLDWTGAPAGTQSFAIGFHDLSNLQGQDPFTHWVMWNIPASATGLPAELPATQTPGVPDANTRQVSFRANDAFAGSGAAGNVYEFQLFALSIASFDPGTDDPDDVEAAIAALNSVLASTTLRARSTPP